MACGCGGSRKKKAQVESARTEALSKPLVSGARRRGEILPGSTFNGRAPKPAV